MNVHSKARCRLAYKYKVRAGVEKGRGFWERSEVVKGKVRRWGV